MKNKPELLENEDIILTNPGFYKDNLRSGWKPGNLYLTSFRLFLWQQARNIFQFSLEEIVGISIQKMSFILRSKEALCLTYRPSGREELLCAWIMVKDVKTWEKKIFERSIYQITLDDVEKVTVELDLESDTIVSYIWQNRFATIEELASLCNASNHMDVLFKIKEVINPQAEKIIGHPLLVFEKSKLDPETGKKVLFSWWLVGRAKIEERRVPYLDLFDEGDFIRITTLLNGIDEKSLQLRVIQDKLIIHTNSLEKKYQEEITLPAPVNPEKIIRRYNNGIFEVRLQKI